MGIVLSRKTHPLGLISVIIIHHIVSAGFGILDEVVMILQVRRRNKVALYILFFPLGPIQNDDGIPIPLRYRRWNHKIVVGTGTFAQLEVANFQSP